MIVSGGSQEWCAGVFAVGFDTEGGLPPCESAKSAREIAREFIRVGDRGSARYWLGYAAAAAAWEAERS